MRATLPIPVTWRSLAGFHAAKTAVAAGLSWLIAYNVVGNNIPVFAPLAALLTVQVTVWESVSRGVQRILGVVVGVLVSYGFARLAGINAWSIALIVFVSLLAGRALHLGQQGSIQVPVSALLVLVLGATNSGYALDRVVDTVVGAGVGILVNLVAVPRTHLEQAQEAVHEFCGAMATLLSDIAAGLSQPETDRCAYLARARKLGDQAEAAALVVQRTETATRWNPIGRRDRPTLERLQGALRVLFVVERPVRGIARTLADAPDGSLLPPPVASPSAELLREVAGELVSWADRVTSRQGQPRGANTANAVARPTAPAAPAAPAGTAPTVPEPSATALYRSVLLASRAPGITPEAAAIASVIALDAHRIIEELAASPRPCRHPR